MKTRGISQEQLKLIACLTMLIDHIAATVVLAVMPRTGPAAYQAYQIYQLMRVIGRIAFPIYCFLLAEGAHYTHDPKKYALRLAIGAVLSEIPFDLAFRGGLTLRSQSVMLTLLLGFLALEAMARCRKPLLRLLAMAPFALLAELLQTDYGGGGVLMIVLFSLSREMRHRWLVQLVGMVLIIQYCMGPQALVQFGGFQCSIELFALIALIPIAAYSGRKAGSGKAAQWAFYLFYPVHLTVLWLLETVLR